MRPAAVSKEDGSKSNTDNSSPIHNGLGRHLPTFCLRAVLKKLLFCEASGVLPISEQTWPWTWFTASYPYMQSAPGQGRLLANVVRAPLDTEIKGDQLRL